MASWPKTLQLELPGFGNVLFCHGTPRDENEIFTARTAEERLLPAFADIDVDFVVCGHTHMQFERALGKTRIVNAGSVGMPFDEPGAYWLLLGSDLQFRRTDYDRNAAAEQIRATSYPDAEQFAAQHVVQTPSRAQMEEILARAELR